MGYLPFRDRPDFASITEDQQGLIVELADRLEQQARQDYHRDRCGCLEGATYFSACRYGANYASVTAEEIIASLLVEGRLSGSALGESGGTR